MPSNTVQSLSGLCHSRLQHLPDNAKPKKFMTTLQSLCKQNASRELLQLIQGWVTGGIMNICASSPAKKIRSNCKKKVQPKEGEAKPYLAAQMLSSMLDHGVCQNQLQKTCPDLLIEMLSFLDAIKEKFEQMDEKSHNGYTSALIKKILLNLMKIAALFYHTNMSECEKFIDDLISWCASSLLQYLKCNSDKGLQLSEKKRKLKKSSSTDIVRSKLATDICKDVFKVCSDMVVLGQFDVSKCSALQFSAKVLKSESASAFILPVTKLLNNHLVYSILSFALNKDTSLANKLPTLFCEIIHALSKENCIDSIPVSEGKEVQLILSNYIHTIYEGKMCRNECSSLTSLIAESAVSSFAKCSKGVIENKSCEPFKSICVHGAPAFFFNLMIMRPEVMPLYLKAIFECFLRSELKVENFIAHCLILCHILELKSISFKKNTHTDNLLDSMKEALDQIFPPQVNGANIENKADDNDSAENSQFIEERFRNHCKNEFAKIQSQYETKNVPEKEGA